MNRNVPVRWEKTTKRCVSDEAYAALRSRKFKEYRTSMRDTENYSFGRAQDGHSSFHVEEEQVAN